MKTFIAKHNGKCAISGEDIIAGQTNIGFLRNSIVLAEYMDKGAVVAYMNQLVDAIISLAETITDGNPEKIKNDAEQFRGTIETSWMFGSCLTLAPRLRGWVKNLSEE